MTNASQGAIYPRYCFNLSPTFNTWCLLRVAQIHALKQHAGFEGEDFFFYKKLPVKWVRIVGVIVAVDEFAGRRLFTVDDSSGACIEAMILVPVAKPHTSQEIKGIEPTIEPTTAQAPAQLYNDIVAGTIVDVKGRLSTFRDVKQINVEKITTLRTTAQEVALWEKMTKFQREVLDRPWVLCNRDVRRCRKEAERSEEQADKKRQRQKASSDRTMAKAAMKSPEAPTTASAVEKSASRDIQAVRLRELIQVGAASGKYSALGL